MTTLQRVAPIFAMRDLGVSLAHCRRLGFATREYDGGGYGFATRDGVEIHLGVVPTDGRAGAAYIWVDDADEVARAWRAAGGEVHGPEDTAWGQTRVRSSTQTAT
ncbi:MAG TPA: hypothetical protein VKD67_12865 [Acidimicrobiales bacterium]|nr:hypothetical protein [Acidimicrobiales bacterium]